MCMTVRSQVDSQADLVLRIHFLWRILFAMLAIAALYYSWGRTLAGIAAWQKISIAITVAIASIFSVLGAVQIFRRHHSGRMISLVLDYLAFLICAVLVLNTGGAFIGIDAFAGTFVSGI